MLEFFDHVKHDPRDVSQSTAEPGLRDRHPMPRVHVGLSENRTARFRRDSHHVRARPAVHRIEGPQILPCRVPQQGHFLRKRDESDSRRSCRRLPAAAHDGRRRLLGARRNQDRSHGPLRTSRPRRRRSRPCKIRTRSGFPSKAASTSTRSRHATSRLWWKSTSTKHTPPGCARCVSSTAVASACSAASSSRRSSGTRWCWNFLTIRRRIWAQLLPS